MFPITDFVLSVADKCGGLHDKSSGGTTWRSDDRWGRSESSSSLSTSEPMKSQNTTSERRGEEYHRDKEH